jgi:putative transposase
VAIYYIDVAQLIVSQCVACFYQHETVTFCSNAPAGPLLPPYSPDFSPIELFWSKVKTFLRGSAARTRDALDGEIRNALDAVTETDIKGWFKHCGYCTESN